MKKYIRIVNTGEIEQNAFKLIGASSKRNDKTKIGFFGSGLKYAMAFLLRENIEFKIYSGTEEVKVTTRVVQHREQDFNVIQVDGEDTSMTTEMGPKWQHWGAVREVYCNAVDEGNDDITIVDEFEIVPESGSTVFYIELTPDLTNIVERWDDYFSKDRNDIVHQDIAGTKIFWSKPSNDVNDLIIYRKGIQCHLGIDMPSCFHYDFPWVDINESREITSMYSFRASLVEFYSSKVDTDTLRILLIKMDKGLAKFEYGLDWSSNMYGMAKKTWIDAVGDKILVAAEIAGWYADIIERNGRDKYLLLPNYMVKHVQQQIPDIKVLGENIGGVTFCKLEATDKQTFLLKDVKRFFTEADYPVDYDIHIVKFEDSYILGHAKDNNIYISDKVFDQGRRKLAEVIYEENEHLKTNLYDETRGFQDHLIGQVISRMEEKHAFFL